LFDLKQAHTRAAAADFVFAPPTFRVSAPPPPTLNLRRAAADQMMPTQGSNSNCVAASDGCHYCCRCRCIHRAVQGTKSITSQMTQCRIILLLQPITKLYLFRIELKLRDDFRCFRSKMCFRTLCTVPLNSTIENNVISL